MKGKAYLSGLFIIVAVTTALYWPQGQSNLLQREAVSARVSYVIDGDTMVLEGVEPRIRLWGVDAPEKGEPGAQAATNALRDLSDNQLVSYIEMDRDRYGRIVARIFLPDQREVNRLLIESGIAEEYCRYSKDFYGHCTRQ